MSKAEARLLLTIRELVQAQLDESTEQAVRRVVAQQATQASDYESMDDERIQAAVRKFMKIGGWADRWEGLLLTFAKDLLAGLQHQRKPREDTL